MVPIIGAIASGIFNLASGWLEGRRKKAERDDAIAAARTQAQIDLIKNDQEHAQRWDILMAEGSLNSWKDEFWTIFLAIPLVLLFWPDPEINEIAERGFQRMAEAPDWYVALVMVAVAAAFGVRKIIEFVDRFKK